MFNLHDLDSVKAVQQELIQQMKAVAADPSATDNPISQGIDLALLKRSGKPDDTLKAEILQALDSHRAQILEALKGQQLALSSVGRHIREGYQGSLFRLFENPAMEVLDGGAYLQRAIDRGDLETLKVAATQIVNRLNRARSIRDQALRTTTTITPPAGEVGLTGHAPSVS